MIFKNQLELSLKNIELLMNNEPLHQKIEKSIDQILIQINKENPLLVCGNGGSSADAEHIVGELVGRFLKERKAINAISLSSNSATLTAWANDYSYETIFSRQVEAYGKNGGIFWGISTSGNSKNIVLAAKKAKDLGLEVIALTGEGGGELAKYSDILIDVPSRSTPRIQEMHIMIYHYMCQKIEDLYIGKG